MRVMEAWWVKEVRSLPLIHGSLLEALCDSHEQLRSRVEQLERLQDGKADRDSVDRSHVQPVVGMHEGESGVHELLRRDR